MNKRKGCRIIGAFLIINVLLNLSPSSFAYAKESVSSDSEIIVSLGDSYSSGEGIEPFYGQELSNEQKVKNEDWLAHRSEKSWSSLLQLPSVEGTMGDNKGKNWFFKAASGAVTENLNYSFTKEYNKGKCEGRYNLPPQLSIFEELDNQGIEVDYVTITIGGNDVGFADIIRSCVFGSTYLNLSGLSDKLDDTWEDFETEGGTKDRLIDAYISISEAAPEAEIIVAGYPQLLDKEGKGLFMSKEEADEVNKNVSKFNDAIEEIVKTCEMSGLNINFVSVEGAFEGHEAYSDNPYINEVMFGARGEDLKDFKLASEYSIHPNEEGAKAYAACMQEKIDELEVEKQNSIIDEDMELSDNPEASDDEVEADELHYSGAIVKPEDVVLKMFDALQGGDYETAAECLDPAVEQQLDFWGGIASTLMQLFTGEYLSWGQLVLEAAGATEVDVIECHSDNYVMDSRSIILSEWLPEIPVLKDLLCTEADVHVKYRYMYNGQYHTIEETYHVRRYEWSGWRIEEGY